MPFLKDLPCEIAIFGAHDLGLQESSAGDAKPVWEDFRRETASRQRVLHALAQRAGGLFALRVSRRGPMRQ